MQNKKNFFEYIDNFSKYKEIESVLLYGKKIKGKKLTIAIPTYKRENLLKESLKSAINQKKFDDYEIIIVDNDDNFDNKKCLEIVRSFNCDKIKYYKNKSNLGMYGNWNRCIELASGEYITILNDDDWLEENYLFEMMNNIGKKDGIFCDYFKKDFRFFKQINQEKTKLIYKIKKKFDLKIKELYFYNIIPGSLGVILKVDKLKRLGGYNSNYFPISDYVLTSNYIYNYNCIQLTSKLTNYRIQENESLKNEIIIEFIENDFEFRKYLLDKSIVPKFYYKYLNILKNNQILYYKNIWKIEVPLKNEKIKFLDKLSYFIYFKYLKIIKYFNNY